MNISQDVLKIIISMRDDMDMVDLRKKYDVVLDELYGHPLFMGNCDICCVDVSEKRKFNCVDCSFRCCNLCLDTVDTRKCNICLMTDSFND